ncbi:hypothetical protein AALC25_12285 [Lachnospiraceae bacterium 29-84]
MREQAKRWLESQMEEKHIPIEVVASVLGIPQENMRVGSGQRLDADELLRICAYLCIRPENIPIE